MTTCNMNGSVINIDEALNLRNQADDRGMDGEEYFCINCDQPVRAHASGGKAGAHFEHLERNPSCKLST